MEGGSISIGVMSSTLFQNEESTSMGTPWHDSKAGHMPISVAHVYWMRDVNQKSHYRIKISLPYQSISITNTQKKSVKKLNSWLHFVNFSKRCVVCICSNCLWNGKLGRAQIRFILLLFWPSWWDWNMRDSDACTATVSFERSPSFQMLHHRHSLLPRLCTSTFAVGHIWVPLQGNISVRRVRYVWRRAKTGFYTKVKIWFELPRSLSPVFKIRLKI